MQYEVAWLIICIFFWVLCAAAIILSGAWMYIQLMYYHWDKQDRERENVVQQIVETVNEKLDEFEE